MKKRDLLDRIEELERRLREVEARPLPAFPLIYVEPLYTTYRPWWGIYPPVIGPPTITCSTGFGNTTNVTTVGQVEAWAAGPQQGM